MKLSDGRALTIIFVIVVALSVSVVYANVTTFEPEIYQSSGYSDTHDYVEMFHGGRGRAHRGYRILVPLAASLVPAPPAGLFADGASPDRVLAFKFGVVNLLLLVGAGLLLYILQARLGFTYIESVFGVVLFLGSVPVVRSSGLPLADTALYFFFLLSLLSILNNQPTWIIPSVGIGALANELVLLTLFAILLAPLSVRGKSKHIAATVPGIAAYIAVRLTVETAGAGAYIEADLIDRMVRSAGRLLTFDGLVDFFILSFGVVWIPAGWATFRCELPCFLRRWAWLVPIIVSGVLAGGGNLGRSTFTAFPIVIPLAALGLSNWLTGKQDFSDPSSDMILGGA